MLHFFDPAHEELRPLTRDDPSAFAPPPAFGPFRVLHQVGVGALGPVFRTYEPTRDRLIAVKVFRLDITPEQAQSLADELSGAAEASLFHPSIVEPIAAGVQGTVAYRAEEYVAAESLDVAMRHYAPARLDKILPFITQLAGAIDFARAAGVGHGALHPRDVFVTPDEARIAGFGVVEALDRVGIRAPVRRPYTAPERIEGTAWGTPADVFSLAAITFELLTARRPAGTGRDIGALSAADLGRHEGAVHAVLARAMDQDPGRRYLSALGFAAALEAASRGITDVAGGVEVASAAVADPQAAIAPDAVATDPDRQELALAERSEPDHDARAAQTSDDADGAELVPATAQPVGREGEREDEVDTAVPPAAAVEERVVQPEGEEGFTEPETIDDVDTERDDDEVYHALVEAERRERDALEAEQERRLFDAEHAEQENEAAADRYIHLADENELPLRADAAEREGDEDDSVRAQPVGTRALELPALRRDHESATYSDVELAAAAAAATRRERVAGPEEQAMQPREGPRMLHLALTLIAGLLIGFAAGYFVGERDRDSEPRASSTSEAPAAGAAESPPTGREWSEQTVAPATGSRAAPGAQPPTAAPPVPSESTSPDGATPALAERTGSRASRGRLVVQSTPARAGVTVNGRWRGRTPLTLDDLPFGRYSVRIVQPGFDVAREQVTLSSSQSSRTLSVNLQRTAAARADAGAAASGDTSGVLFVDSRPRGAQVFVDGRLVGTTPLRLPDVKIGSHVVRLELAGHRRWSTSASVSAARETRVTGSLDPLQ